MNDWQLLQDYSVRGSEAAFRLLVDRHLNLVYSAALRQGNDPQLAEEICQTVFILLARKAASLQPGIVLAGWLFRTTRFVAARARRAEQRRQRREQEAYAMQQLTAPEEAWPRLGPLLDDALAHLGETDRNALLLRFCADKSHKETGVALGLSEEAARKRVDRALEKLRGWFAGRGVKVSVTVLAATLAAHAVQAAPAPLAGSVAASACAGTALAPAALPALAREVLRAWQWSRIQLAGALAGAALLMVGVGIRLTPRHATGPVSAAGSPEPVPMAQAAAAPATTHSTSRVSRPASTTKVSGQVLQLHVVARDTGEPVANAQLAVNTVTGGEWRQRFDLLTDANGFAEVPYPPETGRLDVGVLSWGWGARYVTWIPGREDFIPAEYTLQVERATNSMGGWLRDAQGRPVANAEVTASFDGTGDVSNRETQRERFGFQAEAVVARSDAQGWWTCAVIPSNHHGGFTLKARHPAFRPATLLYGPPANGGHPPEPESWQRLWTGKLVTRMEAALTVKGRVRDESGRPIAQAVIAHEPYATEAVVTQTDTNGEFAIVALEASDFDFSVSAPGFAPEYRQVKVQEDLAPVEVRLKPGALLRLRLVDEQGNAVPGARVGLEQWGEVRHKLKWAGESGADGRLEWASAPRAEPLELYAIKDGWCYSRELRFKADGEEHTVTMRRALEVSGYVTDAETGRPLVEFKAYPGYGEGEYAWERLDTRHGKDGQFVVRFQEYREPWRLRVEAEGYAPFVSDPIPPEFTGTLQVALQRLDPGRAVRGVVWRPDRQPAADAEVALLTLEHSATLKGSGFRHDAADQLVVKADAQGHFSFGPDPRAHTVVAVSPNGFARVRVQDPRQALNVVLEPWGRIEGALDADVRAVPVESIVLSGFSSQPQGELRFDFDAARPDDAGRFVFELVPPESLCLYLNSGVGKSYHHRTLVSVLPGQTANVVLTNSGWRLKGRFTSPEGREAKKFKQVVAYLNNQVPPVPTPEGLSGDAARLWLMDFENSAAGRQRALSRHGLNIKPNADGSFETDESLPPGDYRLLVVVDGSVRLERPITLAAPTEGAPGLYDLGTIAIPAGTPEAEQ